MEGRKKISSEEFSTKQGNSRFTELANEQYVNAEKFYKSRPEYAIECYKTAADYGHDVAQYKYAAILEYQKKTNEAVLYYLMAAVQGHAPTYHKLASISLFLSSKISALKRLLENQGLLKDNKLVLGDSEGKFYQHNQTEITQTICVFRVFMQLYGYLCSKSPDEHEQLEKRKDFAQILKHILDTDVDKNPNDIKIKLQTHEDETKLKFLATNYGSFNGRKFLTLLGHQTYRDLRTQCFNVLKETPANVLKSVVTCVYDEIQKDNQVTIGTAQDIMNAYRGLRP